MEMLVVMAVMALITAMAMPDIGRLMPGLRQRHAAVELAAALRDARGQAIRSNTETTLTLDVRSRRYALSHRGNPQRLGGAFALSMQAAAFETSGNHLGSIRFFPDGSSTGGSISLASGRETHTVVVDWLTGRVQISE
jgi:general secretion pathway protein H